MELSKLKAKLAASSEERVTKGSSGGVRGGALSHSLALNDDGSPSDTTVHQLSLTGLEKQSVGALPVRGARQPPPSTLIHPPPRVRCLSPCWWPTRSRAHL